MKFVHTSCTASGCLAVVRGRGGERFPDMAANFSSKFSQASDESCVRPIRWPPWGQWNIYGRISARPWPSF